MYDIKIVPDIFQIMFSKAIEDEGMYGSDSLWLNDLGLMLGYFTSLEYPECLYGLIRCLSYAYIRDSFNIILG